MYSTGDALYGTPQYGATVYGQPSYGQAPYGQLSGGSSPALSRAASPQPRPPALAAGASPPYVPHTGHGYGPAARVRLQRVPSHAGMASPPALETTALPRVASSRHGGNAGGPGSVPLGASPTRAAAANAAVAGAAHVGGGDGAGGGGGVGGMWATALGPSGEYLCRAAYPSPATSQRLGRRNIGLFRLRNST